MTSSTKREMNQALRERILQDQVVLDMIRRRAYEIFQDRGEEHGRSHEDWLQAETEILHELIEGDLHHGFESASADYSASLDRQVIPAYKPSTENPETGRTAHAAPLNSLSGGPIPPVTKLPPLSVADPQPVKKKREKASKSSSSRKVKKAAKPADGDAGPSAPALIKAKKSGHKSKAGKKKEKKP